jgi:general nucleoside transport system permease protein
VSWRLERRLDIDTRHAALWRVGGVIVALVIAGIILQLTGRSAFTLLKDSIDSTFGSRRGLEETGVLATPILMNALAVFIAYRMKVWNIGVEGQFYMGAWAATGIGIHLDAPKPLLVLLMSLAGIAAGGAWILVPALARAYLGVNEIITTLLLNFVAIQWVFWFSLDIWRDKAAAVVQATPPVQARLPGLFGSTVLHVGFLVPLVVAVILFYVFRNTRWGYEVEIVGGNPRAAEFAGIDVRRRIVIVMLLSGGLAGLSGAIHLMGATGRLQGTISNQYGLSGFIVAALAGASIVGLLVGGLFIASLLHSGLALQAEGLSVYIVVALYGLTLLGIANAEAASRYRLVREHDAPVEEERVPEVVRS